MGKAFRCYHAKDASGRQLSGRHAHTMRVCLSCGGEFYSTWCGHRICNACDIKERSGFVPKMSTTEMNRIEKVYKETMKRFHVRHSFTDDCMIPDFAD